MKSTKGKKIAVLDAETDPFLVDRIPKPFACGFYDGDVYLEEWGPHAVKRILDRVRGLGTDYVVFVHNGGKFDFWFFWDEIDETKGLTIINGRLVEFDLRETSPYDGQITFRDSVAILPIRLADYQKEEIDYAKFERTARNKNRAEILAYLKSDCLNLFTLVTQFSETFTNERGNIPLTIGQASITEIQKYHPFEKMSEASDRAMRSWYMGGRVQCFASGILKGPWKVYDVNGMYAKAMRDYSHPMADEWDLLEKPPRGNKLWFAKFTGTNRQALPFATKEGLTFEEEEGEFYASSHELIPAMASGMVTVEKWLLVMVPGVTGSFKRFVDHWQKLQIEAEMRGDKGFRLFCKLIKNSGYGKTGQNPATFKDYKLLRDIMADIDLVEAGYEPDVRISDEPFIEIWSKPSNALHGYFNVSIAASVTSAARSILFDGLRKSVSPIYCDTDSIICRSFGGEIDTTKLGAWKCEANADFVAIAGKKMYCLYDKHPKRSVKYPRNGRYNRPHFYPVKWASKGGDLDPWDIMDMARGATVDFVSPIPTFSLSRGIGFIRRKFKKTVVEAKRFK